MLIYDLTEPTNLVVIQPTRFCNIDCKYCYLPHRLSKAQLNEETGREIFAQTLQYFPKTERITYVWHSGEPLTIPVSFYHRLFEVACEENRQLQRTYNHSFQTNATLIDLNWIGLFKEHKVQVGVSLDGPAFIHDKYRVTRGGKGTHARVMDGIRLLRQAEIDFNVICVLTASSLDYPDEIFEFFHENGICRIAFNIDEIDGNNLRTSYEDEASITKYKVFMKRFLELTMTLPDPMYVREFSRILPEIVRERNLTAICTTNLPMKILSFDVQGNYCTFSPELIEMRSGRFADFIMGNIMTDPISQLQDTPIFQQVNKEIQAGLKKCKETCGFWDFCGGGHPSNKFAEHGRFDVAETIQCRVHKKALVQSILEYLEEI